MKVTEAKRLPVVVAIVVAVIAVLIPQSASFAELGEEEDKIERFLASPNVIDYGLDPYVLADSHQYLLQGDRTADGGCVFSGTDDLAPGETITEIEVAYDPSTCQSLMTSGRLTSDDAFLTEGSGTESSEETRAAASGLQPGGMTLAAVARHRAFNWVWYDEPARWAVNCDVEDGFADGCTLPPVNTLRNGIEWTPDGSCAIAPGTTGRMSYRDTWLIGTGWTREQQVWQHSPDPLPCGDNIYSRSWHHYRNAVFCHAVTEALTPFPVFVSPTHTYYQPNEIEGDEFGAARATWSASKSGGCDSFLRVGRRAGHTF